jgi:hypothetical protein
MFKAIAAAVGVPLGLWALAVTVFTAAAAPWEFWIAKGLIASGSLWLFLSYLIWLWQTRDHPAIGLGIKLFLGGLAVIGAIASGIVLIEYSDFREIAFLKQEDAKKSVDSSALVIQQLSRQDYSDQRAIAVQKAILAQWADIESARKLLAEHGRFWPKEDRLEAAEHVLKEMEIVQRSVGVINFLQGGGSLILEIAPNTFRITFPVPMFRVPTITGGGSPNGTTMEVEEVSRVGATLVFKPVSQPVTLLDFLHVSPQGPAQ